MKKLAMAFAAVMIVAGMASSALADPGWANGHRNDHNGRFDRPPQHYWHIDHNQWRHNYQQNHYSHWEHDRQPVVMQRVPVAPPRPYVNAYEPQGASFSMFLPGFSIQIR